MMGLKLRDHVDEILLQAQQGQLPKIVQAGHPQLRRPARPWKNQLPLTVLESLIELMRTVMHRAPGVGLAAPQLGIDLQLAVAEDTPDDSENNALLERTPLPFFAMLNPSYTSLCEGQAERLREGNAPRVKAYEGCLSVRGYRAQIERYQRIRLDYIQPQGVHHHRDLVGWPARIAQHETDHLRGVLYVDKIDTRTLTSEEPPLVSVGN